MAADRILINGHFYTENPDMPWAQAVAIGGSNNTVSTTRQIRRPIL